MPVIPNFRIILFNLAVAGVYLLLAKLVLLFANHHGTVALCWPSGGFALAVLLLNGIGYLPGVFLGAFVTSLGSGNPLPASIVIALGNTLEPACGWWLLTSRMNFNVATCRLYDFFALILAGSHISAIGSIIGSTALMAAGVLHGGTWLETVRYWWMADLLGIVLVTPLILVWKQQPTGWLKPKRLAEVVVVFGLAFLAGQVIFLDWWRNITGSYPQGFMMFLFLSLTAVRLGRHGTLLVLIITAVQALAGASLGVGYFGGDMAKTHLTNLWLYIIIMSVVGMLLAAYISEKNQVVEALRESENRFRTLVNSMPVLVWMSGADTLGTYFNKGWLDFTGRTLEQELGNGWIDGIHPEDLPCFQEMFLAAFDAHREFSMEYRLRRYDGEYRWVIDHGVPRYCSQGIFLGYIGTVFDINDRKNAVIAMHDSEIRFRNLLEKIPLVSVQGYATDGTTNYWNQASEYLYGYTAEEALGKKLTDLIIPPEMRSGVKKAMQQMFATGQPIPASELTLMRKGGGRVDVFSSHAYVHVPGREPEMFCMDIDLTERKRDEERIRKLAFYDPLTQLANRRLLVDRMQQALAETHRNGGYCALLFIDLDNFKTLNDTLGHGNGDLLLQQVAARLVACVREIDTVARLGGDEFVLMLKNLSDSQKEAAVQAEVVSKKILATLNQPYQLVDSDYHNTSSIGIALFVDNHASVEDLMKRADIAMYQAKKAGRNTFRFFDPDMQAALEARLAMEKSLRMALANNQLRLYYQVQVDNSGRIYGAEVLLRWQHPERGMITPVDFIPLAEEIGVIVPIGLWVLEKACTQLNIWKADPEKQHLQLAVNVSALQFRQTDFDEQVAGILKKTDVKPSRLNLELTESLVLDNIDGSVEKMKILKKIGVRFSMDDFGTGYSSLSSLKKLPFDQLKIDRSFVRDITTDADDATIVQTIIAMASNLGMSVIAEGVETDQQKNFLVEHNCLHFQGYLFGKPMPVEELEQLLYRVL